MVLLSVHLLNGECGNLSATMSCVPIHGESLSSDTETIVITAHFEWSGLCESSSASMILISPPRIDYVGSRSQCVDLDVHILSFTLGWLLFI